MMNSLAGLFQTWISLEVHSTEKLITAQVFLVDVPCVHLFPSNAMHLACVLQFIPLALLEKFPLAGFLFLEVSIQHKYFCGAAQVCMLHYH